MKTTSIILFALMVFSLALSAQDLCGVYVNQKADMYEDQYLVVEQCTNGGLTAFYYGITDDFDEAREGYLPGFFVSRVDNLAVNDGYLDFTVNVNTSNIFATSVPLSIRSANKAEKILKPWTIYPSEEKSIKYRLTIKKDRLFYEGTNSFDSKVFVKVTDKRILKAVESAKETQKSSCGKKEKADMDIKNAPTCVPVSTRSEYEISL